MIRKNQGLSLIQGLNQSAMNIHTDGGCDRNGHADAIGAWAFVASDGHEDCGAGERGTLDGE